MAAIASTTTSTQLLAANARSGFIITNTDPNRLYVLIGTGTASSSNYSFHLDTGDTYDSDVDYDGAIQGVWAADGAGYAQVTEF